jgi:hypothetical protein
MFLGTPTGGDYQNTASFNGEWHMYMATTYDGGQTWTTVDTDAERPRPARLDLHRGTDLRRRPQPA